MRLALPTFVRRHTRLLAATSVAVVIAASTLLAQLATFNPTFEGELWGVRHTLIDAAAPAGVAFVGNTLYVADSEGQTIRAYDNSTGQLVAKVNAQWHFGNSSSPAYGLVPNQLLGTVITVNGANTDALLVSDGASNRVAAFTTAGEYLFTLRLQRPTQDPLNEIGIGELALSAGARFNLRTTRTRTLTLTGVFAAAWNEQAESGAFDGGAMVFPSTSAFAVVGSEFEASAAVIKRGNEHDPVAPAPRNVFGVEFDTAGNLYVLDAFTERLHVYGPALNHLFSFGTPVADGTTAEFHEPWGLAFWPDASGTSGRLFINDTYKNRILVYRPVDGPDAGSVIDNLQFETAIRGFIASQPAIEPFSLALDPASGSIALTDFAAPRTIVLQLPRLAAYNVQVLNQNNAVIDSVCTGASYKARFSLTVPVGRAAVNAVVPQLRINTVLTTAPAVPAATYPSPLTLSAGQVATFTYALTAPAAPAADINLLAGATTSSSTDVLHRAHIIPVANCAGDTDPSTITAAPSTPPQVSGWTPVFDDSFSVRLTAQDNDGILSVEYQLEGANETGDDSTTIAFPDEPTDAVVDVPLPAFGRTTLTYRVRDGNGIWSPWRTFSVRLKLVEHRTTNEGVHVQFRIGDPEGTGITYSVSGLPAGITFATNTGQFAGQVSMDASDPHSTTEPEASGVYTVVVTERNEATSATSEVSFIWTINHINRAPVIFQPIFGPINKGQYFEIQIVGSDPDGDPAVFTATGRSIPSGFEFPETVSINPVTGLISGVFPEDAEGGYRVIVGLAECSAQTPAPPCDGPPLPGSRLATVYNITLEVRDVNHPPDLINPGPQTNVEGDSVSLAVAVSDPESDPMVITAGGLPTGLTIDAATGVITGTIDASAAGNFSVTIVADDGVNPEKPRVTFPWTVTRRNRPPTISTVPITNVEGDSVNRAVSGNDPDGDQVTHTATGLPPGLTMAPSGVVSGSLGFDTAAVYSVTVTVSDGKAQSSSTFAWTVANLNRGPVFTPVSRFNLEGDVVSVLLGAVDPDGDSLVYSSVTLPPTLTLDTATGLVTGTLGIGSAGTYQVIVGVGDGSLAVSKTFTWTVVTNRPPVCIAASASPGLLWPPNHKPVYITIAGITDPDGGTLTIRFNSILQDEPTNTKGDGNTTQDARIENDGTRAWVRAERMGGENGRVYILGFTATDGKESCSGTVSVGVPHDKGNQNVAILSPGRWDSITGALVTPPPPIVRVTKK